jgi:hypothetical protein
MRASALLVRAFQSITQNKLKYIAGIPNWQASVIRLDRHKKTAWFPKRFFKLFASAESSYATSMTC